MSAAPKYVVRYTYPGTAGGKPVGVVYVQALRDSIPDYPDDVFTYTKELAGATRWEYEDAVEAIRMKHWPDGALVLAGEAAQVLP